MKGLLVSFVVGLLVGVVYGMIRAKSPAPPTAALIGLLGMVLGEQAGVWLLAKKIEATSAYSARIVGELKHEQHRPNVEAASSVGTKGVLNEFSSAICAGLFPCSHVDCISAEWSRDH
jgi:XapX domain-containing protein